MEEPSRRSVLTDGEIEPAVSVVIGVRGTALLAVDDQSGTLTLDRLEPAFAVAEE